MTAEKSTIAPSEKPEPDRPQRPADLFWRLLLAFVVGFGLPVLACFGFLIVSAFSLNLVFAGANAEAVRPRGAAGTGDAVALIRVEGPIVSSSGPFDVGVASAERIVRRIDRAVADASVKAIVLAVNSPGGGVVASDLIHHALDSQDKPVVVSMGDVAASGGYYISATADWIVANPNTLTGSIGVISQFVSVEGLLEEYGVDTIIIVSGPRKDFGSPFRDMTTEERAYWQTIVDETYEGFVALVAAGRPLTDETVRELADGSVYTGRQALANGLVDQLGYEEDAIAKAAELGGIEGEPRIVEYEDIVTFQDLFFGFASQGRLPSPAELLRWIGHPTLEARWVGP